MEKKELRKEIEKFNRRVANTKLRFELLFKFIKYFLFFKLQLVSQNDNESKSSSYNSESKLI